MKKIKKCGFVLIVCLVSVIIVGVYFINQNWTIRYASVFDGFFGKGNWKCIDEEKKTISIRSCQRMFRENSIIGIFYMMMVKMNQSGISQIMFIK